MKKILIVILGLVANRNRHLVYPLTEPAPDRQGQGRGARQRTRCGNFSAADEDYFHDMDAAVADASDSRDATLDRLVRPATTCCGTNGGHQRGALDFLKCSLPSEAEGQPRSPLGIFGLV